MNKLNARHLSTIYMTIMSNYGNNERMKKMRGKNGLDTKNTIELLIIYFRAKAMFVN